MLIALVIALAFYLNSQLLMAGLEFQAISDQLRHQSRLIQAGTLNQALDVRLRMGGDLPINKGDLASEYPALQSLINSDFTGYEQANEISGGIRGERNLFYLHTLKSFENIDITAAGFNACGVTAFNIGDTWCPPVIAPEDYTLWRYSTAEQGLRLAQAQRQRLTFLARQVGEHFRAEGDYPAAPTGTTDLSALTVPAAPVLASNCTGSLYYWESIPLDCSQLFNLWGGAIQVASGADYFILFTTTPFTTASGNPEVIYVDLTI